MHNCLHLPYRVLLLTLAVLSALLMLAASSFLVSHAQTAPVGSPILQSFQDGAAPSSSYLGTRDTYIEGNTPDAAHGNEINLIVGGGITTTEYSNSLLQWDLSGIPPLSSVQAVSVTLYITETASYQYSIYQVKKSWDEGQATWNQASASNPWFVPGGFGGPDVDITALAVFTASHYITPTWGLMTIPLNAKGVTMVQSWVNTPSSNTGLMISSYNTPPIQAVFLSRQFRIPSYRPKLTVKYISAATAPAATATTASTSTAGAATATSSSPLSTAFPTTASGAAQQGTATLAPQPPGGSAVRTLPATGGRESPPVARVFAVALVIGLVLLLAGLAGIIYGLLSRKRQSTWSGWLTRMGVGLVAGSLVFGLAAWLVWLNARPAPAVAGENSPLTTLPASLAHAGDLAAPTPLKLPDYTAPTPTLQATLAEGEQAPDTSPPLRLEIASLEVNAVVKYVPFDGQSWLIGGLQQEAAWMGDTSWPGLGENTALTAHVSLPDGSDGPFRRLADLQVGEVVLLTTQENLYTYRVRELKTVAETDLSVLEPTGASVLTLITCADWSSDQNKYLSRLVVVADLEKVEPISQASSAAP
jgi:LPXTG-site transpeptidase (sortase) family protein